MHLAIALAAGSTIGAGLLGFLVFVGLLGACALLFRSLNHQLRKVPAEFPADGDGGAKPPREEPADRV